MANNTNNGTTNPQKDAGASRGPNVPGQTNPSSSKSGTRTGTINPANKAAPGNPRTKGRNVPVATPQMSRRMAARHQRDLKQQRRLIYVAIAIIVLIVLVFAVGIYQSLIGPNIQTLATFDGVSVNSGDYYTYRKIVLYKELGQLQNINGGASGDQQQQIQQQISQISSEISNVQGSPVDQPTLERLVSNIILERAAKDKLGITVSDAELNQGLTSEFALYTPTANPAQGQATQTANVIATASGVQATKTASVVTPLPTNTPATKPVVPTDVAAHGTEIALTKAAGGNSTPNPSASGTAVGTPTSVVESNTGSANASPLANTPANATAAGASPAVSSSVTGTTTVAATPTPAPTATPLPADKANGTVNAQQNGVMKNLQAATGVSTDDYKKFWVKPNLLQEKVTTKLISQLPVPGQPFNELQIHPAHILVSDEQTAKDIQAKLKAASAADLPNLFGQLARQYDATTDKTAAAHNGDLGWAVKGQFVDPFWQAAIKLNKGQFSDPVHTQFGWHIIYMLDKKDNGPMEVDVYNYLTDPSKSSDGNSEVYSRWLKTQVDAANAHYDTPPTPVPSATALPTAVFTPVVPPTATAIPPTQPAITGTVSTGASPAASGAANTAAAVGSPSPAASTASAVANTAATGVTSPAAATTSADTTTTTTVAATTPAATVTAK